MGTRSSRPRLGLLTLQGQRSELVLERRNPALSIFEVILEVLYLGLQCNPSGFEILYCPVRSTGSQK